MSTMTHPSFLDDGVYIINRLPRGLDTQRVARWISRGTFSDTSAYTGSFVDDDEDTMMRGKGTSDRQSRHKKGEERRRQGGEHVWNENAKKAVSGDVRRHVDRIRDLRGKVHVRRVKKSEEIEKEKVRVPVPRQWGTFVIKDKDGRVVVVDEEGEFDSGPQEAHDIKKQYERYWVRAASTVEPSSPFRVASSTYLPPPDQHRDANWFAEGAETAKEAHDKVEWNCIMNSPRPLSPIPESEDEDASSSTSRESIQSPIDFMAAVTGWKNNSQISTTRDSRSSSGSINEDGGWVSPSRLPHPFTWATSPSNSHEGWSRAPKAADNPEWTDSDTSSSQQNDFNGPARSCSEATWDGFERRKTLSDVSIAGSHSIRSSLLESMQSHHDSAMSRRRGTSREEVRVGNQHGWEHGSNGRSNARHASSSDEGNATYRNANWGETPARVAKD